MPIEIIPQSTDVAGGNNAQLLKAMKERKALQEMLSGGTGSRARQEAAPAFAPQNMGQAAFGYAGVAANALGDRMTLEREKKAQADRIGAAADSLGAIDPDGFGKLPRAARIGLLLGDPELPSKVAQKVYEVRNRKPERIATSPGQTLTEFDDRPGRPQAPAQMAPGAAPASPGAPMAPGGGRTVVQGLSAARYEEEKARGKGLGERGMAILEAGDKAPVTKGRIMAMESLLDKVPTGKLAPAQATVGGWMKAMGFSDETLKFVKIPPNAPMTVQTANALVSDLVIAKLGAGGFPTNNFSNTDREFLRSGIFDASDTVEANKFKLKALRKVVELDERKAAEWADASQRGQSFLDFNKDFNARLSKENIFADLYAEAGMKGEAPQGAAAPQGIMSAPAQPSIDDLLKKYGPQ